MKKLINYISVIILVCFSFYYTDYASKIIKSYDPIMKEIVSVSSNYVIEPLDCTLINNNIIPGKSGIEIDIDKSYYKMKKYGKFNDKLLEYKSTDPLNSIKNNYDKYVISGNKSNNLVSIIILLNDEDNINKIYYYLYKYNNIDVFIVNEMNYSKIKEFNINLLFSNKKKFCFTTEDNYDLLKECSNNRIYTIKSKIINNYLDLNLENGSIIVINDSNIDKLDLIINKIIKYGKKLVSISDLIKE